MSKPADQSEIPSVSKHVSFEVDEVTEAAEAKEIEPTSQPRSKVVSKLFEILSNGFGFVWKDLTKKHLLWVKIIFFLQSASLVALYPYLTIHLKALGFTIEDASLVNSVIPAADVIGPPLAGFLADKLGNFRLFMAGLTFLNGASSLLLLALPPLKRSIAAPIAVGVINATSTASDSGLAASEVMNMNNWMESEFWAYLTTRVLLDVLRASSLMLFEGAVVSIIKQHGGDYGLQKLFGTFGAVIFGPLSGVLIDFGEGASAYHGVIILYFCIRVVTALCILKLSLDFKPPGKKVLSNLSQVLCKVELLAFLGAFLVAGILWGYLENFLFWHLEDLGATKFLMGISLAIGTIAGVPVTMFSRMLIAKLGHKRIVVLALALYAVRMFGYAELLTAEPFLALEALKPFCTTLLLIAVMTFVKDNAGLTTISTVEAIFGSAYFGVGRGLGGLFGGLAIEAVGNVNTFRIFGLVASISAIVYSVIMLIQRIRNTKKYSVEEIERRRDLHRGASV